MTGNMIGKEGICKWCGKRITKTTRWVVTDDSQYPSVCLSARNTNPPLQHEPRES